MVRHIYLVRHGQALSNRIREYSELEQGPDKLTDLGVEQARRAAQAVEMLVRPGYRIVSSPLDRARETAEIVASAVAARERLILDGRLQEKSWEESFEEAARRAWAAAWEHSSDGGVLCVTHGHIIQALVALALGFYDFMQVHPFNCGITYFRDGRLVAFNMSLHLVDAENPMELMD